MTSPATPPAITKLTVKYVVPAPLAIKLSVSDPTCMVVKTVLVVVVDPLFVEEAGNMLVPNTAHVILVVGGRSSPFHVPFSASIINPLVLMINAFVPPETVSVPVLANVNHALVAHISEVAQLVVVSPAVDAVDVVWMVNDPVSVRVPVSALFFA